MEKNTASSYLFQLLVTGWKRIALLTILGLAGGVGYAFLGPKWYEASLSVVPSTTPKGGGVSLAGAAAAAGLVDLPIDIGGGSDVDRVAAIFRSNSVTDAIINKFNLRARYREGYLEDARKELWKHCSTKIDKKPTVVTIECEDKSPEMARAMLVAFADEANQVARRVATSSAREERKFLEARVAKAQADLDKVSRSLREFQEKNKVISLPEQAKAIVTSMATIRAEMIEKQLQLSYVDAFSSADEGTSDQLRRQVGVLQNKLRSLEESRQSSAPPATDPTDTKKGKAVEARNAGGLFPPAMNLPKLQYEIEQLYRDQKIQETLVLLLTQRYETARVNEARDTSTIQVLDVPVRATKQARPKKVLSIGSGVVVGLMLGLAWSFAAARKWGLANPRPIA
jgi:uncharacterized protein involved in exopolysaccharide biosynthesis